MVRVYSQSKGCLTIHSLEKIFKDLGYKTNHLLQKTSQGKALSIGLVPGETGPQPTDTSKRPRSHDDDHIIPTSKQRRKSADGPGGENGIVGHLAPALPSGSAIDDIRVAQQVMPSSTTVGGAGGHPDLPCWPPEGDGDQELRAGTRASKQPSLVCHASMLTESRTVSRTRHREQQL